VGEHFEPFAQVSEPGPRSAYRQCLHCKRSVRLNLRGLFRTHVVAPVPARHAICPGSQQPPVTVLASGDLSTPEPRS
jgi:hypothetical protein